MGTDQRFAAAVIYVDDVPAAVGCYRRVTGLGAAYCDESLGFAVLGEEEQHLSIASHAAGSFMLGDGYTAAHGGRGQRIELAFWSDDVAADYENAIAASTRAVTPPRVMPWGRPSRTSRRRKGRSWASSPAQSRSAAEFRTGGRPVNIARRRDVLRRSLLNSNPSL